MTEPTDLNPRRHDDCIIDPDECNGTNEVCFAEGDMAKTSGLMEQEQQSSSSSSDLQEDKG